MLRRVLAIAGNTYRENIRDKILYNLILFALIMILSSLVLGQLTLGNEDKVILDLGLSSISIFGMLIAIFIGIGLVYKELEKRTVYALLAKPVHRYEWILGKYLGLLFTLLVNLAVMTVGLALAMLYTGGIQAGGYLRLLPAVYLIFLSLALITALALFFSTFSSPALSALFTFFLWVIGHFGNDLLVSANSRNRHPVKWLCRVLYYVIPNLSNFQILDSRSILQGAGLFPADRSHGHLWATVYCVVYCAIPRFACHRDIHAPGFQMKADQRRTIQAAVAFLGICLICAVAGQTGAGPYRIAPRRTGAGTRPALLQLSRSREKDGAWAMTACSRISTGCGPSNTTGAAKRRTKGRCDTRICRRSSTSPRRWIRILMDAYRVGSIFLAEPDPVGAGQPQEALKLLDKGIRAHPQDWRLHYDKGFVYYLFLQDYKAAGETWLAASRLSSAPYWMAGLAAMSMSKGGAIEMASLYGSGSIRNRTARISGRMPGTICSASRWQGTSGRWNSCWRNSGQATGSLSAKPEGASARAKAPDSQPPILRALPTSMILKPARLAQPGNQNPISPGPGNL